MKKVFITAIGALGFLGAAQAITAVEIPQRLLARARAVQRELRGANLEGNSGSALIVADKCVLAQTQEVLKKLEDLEDAADAADSFSAVNELDISGVVDLTLSKNAPLIKEIRDIYWKLGLNKRFVLWQRLVDETLQQLKRG